MSDPNPEYYNQQTVVAYGDLGAGSLFIIYDPTRSAGDRDVNVLVSSLVSALDDAYLQVANNLSELDDVPTARTNLGLGGLAILDPADLESGGSDELEIALSQIPSIDSQASTFLGAATLLAQQQALDLEPGVDVQAWDTLLQTIADAASFDAAGLVAKTGVQTGIDGTKQFIEAITIEKAASSTALLTVLGGSTGGDIIVLRRTSGTTAEYSWSLSGGNLQFKDNVASKQVIALAYDGTYRALYLGTRSAAPANASTEDGLIAAQSHNSSNTNQSAGHLRLQGGLGNGTGTPGDVIIQTGVAGSSGSTVHSVSERARFTATGAFQMGGANTVITSGRYFQLVLVPTASLPSAVGRRGQLAYDSTTEKAICSDNTAWQNLY